MPFYEYECSKCRYYVEVLQKIHDAPLKKCPSCGKNALKKLVSAPVFRLKGSGWYETDFKSDQDGRRNLAGADKDAPAAPAETKDAAKPAGTEGAKSPSAAPAGESASAPASDKPAAPAAPATAARKRRTKTVAKRSPVRPRRGKAKHRGGR
jgi:putative FmdB family regulatory protein